jgi:hypothetical protein
MLGLFGGCGAGPLLDETRDLAVALTDGSGPIAPDLSLPIDAAEEVDAAMPGPTVHDIDTGMVPANTVVTIAGLVLTGFANGEGRQGMTCVYDAYLQDPNGAAPSGIRLFASGGACTLNDAFVCACPLPPKSGTLLDTLARGQNNVELGAVVTVTGTVGIHDPMDGTALRHEIDVTALTVTSAMGMPITPRLINDEATIQKFALRGPAYATYESMLVTIRPLAPTAVTNDDPYGAFTFDGAHFGGDYRSVYGNNGAFPGNLTFKSITGIAEMAFDGEICPRDNFDFVM